MDGTTADEQARRALADLALEAAGVGTFIWNLETGELAWDDALLAMFGYEADGFGSTIAAFDARVHPDDLPTVSQALRGAVERVGVFDAEYRVVLPGGRTRWVAARGRAVAGDDGRTARLVGAAYDTTSQREGEAKLERVLEAMATAFFALDPQWRFTYVNAEAERVLGRSRDELLGGVVWDLFPLAPGSDFETHYRRTMATGEATAFDAYYPEPLDAWYEVRAWRNDDGLAVSFLDISDRVRLAERAQRESRRAVLLSQVSEQVVSAPDAFQAARRLARIAVPELADWAVVTLVEDEGQADAVRGLAWAAAAHRDRELAPLAEEYARERLPHLSGLPLVADAVAGSAVQVLEDDATAQVLAMLPPGRAAELVERLAPRSAVVFPLVGSHGAVGIMSLFNDAARGPVSQDVRLTASHVAGRAGLALENGRLDRQQRRLAERLQRSLLTEPAEPDHVQVVVRYTAATESAQVGGDWYDFFLQPDGSSLLVIGDVLGHDSEAAAGMAQVKSLLRGIAVYSKAGPAEVLRGVDEAMITLGVRTTATAVVARLQQTPDEAYRGVTRLEWANAGHPPPLVVHPDGRVVPVTGLEAELLLGVVPDAERTENVLVLDRGTTVLLYTDGLVERRDQSLDDGLHRLVSTVERLAARDGSLDDLCDAVLAEMVGPRAEDDVAILAARLHRQDVPRPAEAGPRRLPENVEDEPAVLG